MTKPAPAVRFEFFKKHVVPVLLIFFIPILSVGFFRYAQTQTDSEVLHEIESSVRSSKTLEDGQKTKILEFYHRVPVSRIMASTKPEAREMQQQFAPVSVRYAIFRWGQRTGWICITSILLTFAIVGISVALSLRSLKVQYYALRVGWPVLRTSAAIQVLGQGILAVALSFWITAILTHSYFIKLIAIAAMFAFLAIVALCRAIFAKVDNRCEVTGEVLSDSDAPALWKRVRQMAAEIGTAPPDRIVVGVAPNFFVTEHPVTLNRELFQGRTLFLSLPMLKVLNVEEANAVFGHELAHFSGEDTLWSCKISPITGKFVLYQRLLANGLSLIVAHFMNFFWKLYGLSMSRLSREREFRADRIGAERSSNTAMKRALVKVTCYCEYRAKTEHEIIQKQQVDTELNLPMRLEEGYPAFLTGFVGNEHAIEQQIPHPFDSHPPLRSRLEQLGFDAQAALTDPGIQGPVANSWFNEIITADEVELRLWTAQQEALQAFHTRDLAWRLQPKTEEELALVQKFFPREVFRKKNGEEATLDFDRMEFQTWDAPILFKDILKVELRNSITGGKQLVISHRKEGKSRAVTSKVYPEQYKCEKGNLLQAFGHYYSRHKTAEVRSAQSPEEAIA